ncbi:hypothetical protein COEREDRAFT_12277 [Coemansia reversa NRRL 1564]|uniref:Uncharacterized protein n=1 Tax=Coemansia reversa (strain ATCC 12441 / NRRL 1564) TaxID=763665 RepID=A0A2G5B147_COERN|nr:hypothetical protein COEREDRAFT_12277 [Coemansia reversa NRRL 1564]|eukprot:PIA12729.1 hypothetical protein COEREDRAFT_12277 [Coemansia reversa NRRL 1564]
MLANNETAPPPPAPSSPARSYREALLSPPPGATQESVDDVGLTLPPVGTSVTAPAAATAGHATADSAAAPTAPASRKRTAASAANAPTAMPPAKRAGPNRSANALAIADAEEYPELRETPITLKIPGFRPSMFKELTQELLATLGLGRNLSPSAPSNPLSRFRLHGENVTFVLKNREATARLLNTSLVFRGRAFPWTTEKGTLLTIGIVDAPFKATPRRLKAAFAQFGTLSQLTEITRHGYRTGDWKAFLELRDGHDLPAHIALKSCEGQLAQVVPASELIRCHASKKKDASAADSSQAKSAAPAAAMAARPKGMQVPMSAGLITSFAMDAENSAPQNDAGEAASHVAVTEQTNAHREEDMDVYMSETQNPLKRNHRVESDNESLAAAAARGPRKTAPSASGILGATTRAQSKAAPVASDADPGSPRY